MIKFLTSAKTKFLFPDNANKKRVREAISKLDKELFYLVTIEEHHQDRSKDQNAYFHVIVKDYQMRVKDLGNDWTFDQCKQILKIRSGFYDVIENEKGQTLVIAKESSKLSKKAFSVLIEGIKGHYINTFGEEPPESFYKG